MKPTQVSTKQVADLLRMIADEVESGNSIEGSFQYGPDWSDEGGGFPMCAMGTFRTGNLDGQGGMITIGEDDP